MIDEPLKLYRSLPIYLPMIFDFIKFYREVRNRPPRVELGGG